MLVKYEQHKKNIKLNYKLAKKHVSRWEGEQAKPYFENVLKLDPENEKGFKTESIFNLALYETRYEKNAEPLIKFMTQNSDEKYYEQGYYNLLGYYKKTKDQDGLVKTYETMVTKMDSDAGLYNQYAWFIYQEKMKDKYDRGIKLAKKAVELQPDAAHIWDTLAWLHFEKGNKDKALKAMKKAVELEPETKGFKENLKKMEKESS
jgi:tetratricopeptide (TPR) repeat protein